MDHKLLAGTIPHQLTVSNKVTQFLVSDNNLLNYETLNL